MANESTALNSNASIAPDKIWARMRVEAATAAAKEPMLASLLHALILNHDQFQDALSYRLAHKLADPEMNTMQWREVCDSAYQKEPEIVEAALIDLRAVFDRDPACHEFSQPLLFFKGYLALQAQRVSNNLWRHDRASLAQFLQSRISEIFAVDIHPRVQIGRGVFIDHATGIVIGETSVIGDDVSILQNVTLGGTGKDKGDRHPKIRRGALISVCLLYTSDAADE